MQPNFVSHGKFKNLVHMLTSTRFSYRCLCKYSLLFLIKMVEKKLQITCKHNLNMLIT